MAQDKERDRYKLMAYKLRAYKVRANFLKKKNKALEEELKKSSNYIKYLEDRIDFLEELREE